MPPRNTTLLARPPVLTHLMEMKSSMRVMKHPDRATCHPNRQYSVKGLCHSCYNHQWYLNHKDRQRKAARRWAQKNRKKINRRSRERYWTHREQEKERRRKDYEKHKDKILAKHRQYRETHRDFVRQLVNNWSNRNRDKIKDNALKHDFGISYVQYQSLLQFQNGKCAICRKPNCINIALAVDHNHITRQVRGLLCYRCNRNLTWAEKFQTRALEYLAHPPILLLLRSKNEIIIEANK